MNESRLDVNNIQGNIIKGHGRKNAWCVFIKRKDLLKNWILRYSHMVTSAASQDLHKRLRDHSLKINNGRNLLPRLLTCFFLSKKGLELIRGNNLHGLVPQEFELESMENNDINDPAKEEWEPLYQDSIFGMILMAFQDETEDGGINFLQNIISSMFQGYAINKDYFIEKGQVLRKKKDVIEHFGYLDGISQPILLKGSENLILNEENCQRLVFDAYEGSFFVYRKLEQNVALFHENVRQISNELNISSEKAGARTIGRFTNGTPLTYFDTPVEIDNSSFEVADIDQVKEFNSNPDKPYPEIDSHGQRCPFNSHIRKSNPRMNHIGDKNFDVRKIVRRGIPYDSIGRGQPSKWSNNFLPESGVGLLFMCYQKNIKTQFEHIQNAWCNNPDFPKGKNTGIDPLIGQNENFNSESLVTLKGGEYFYAPSLTIIKQFKQILEEKDVLIPEKG